MLFKTNHIPYLRDFFEVFQILFSNNFIDFYTCWSCFTEWYEKEQRIKLRPLRIHNGERCALRFSALNAAHQWLHSKWRAARESVIFKSSTRRPWGRGRKAQLVLLGYYLGGLEGEWRVPKVLAHPCSQGSLSFFLENPEKSISRKNRETIG